LWGKGGGAAGNQTLNHPRIGEGGGRGKGGKENWGGSLNQKRGQARGGKKDNLTISDTVQVRGRKRGRRGGCRLVWEKKPGGGTGKIRTTKGKRGLTARPGPGHVAKNTL